MIIKPHLKLQVYLVETSKLESKITEAEENLKEL